MARMLVRYEFFLMCKERCGRRDDGRDVDLPKLACLTKMTCTHVPDHVGLDVRPPKTFCEECGRRVNSFMADVAVGLREDAEAVVGPDDELVFAGGVTAEESGVGTEEAGGISDERVEGGVGKMGRWDEGVQIVVYKLESGVFVDGSVGAWNRGGKGRGKRCRMVRLRRKVRRNDCGRIRWAGAWWLGGGQRMVHVC